MKLTRLDKRILQSLWFKARSQKELAEEYAIEDPIYGYHVTVSRRVPRLRAFGLIEDVAERCQHCNSALTRGHKNVPLILTEKGREVANN